MSKTLSCGCIIFSAGSFKYCPLHAAAPDLLTAMKQAQPKLRHETDACAVVSVGTCARCTADAIIKKVEARK